jgi:endonuclease/exonuclease/phosphatase family metal-dependent hydrolase
MKSILFLVLAGASLVLQAQQVRFMTYNIRYDSPNDGPDRWEFRKQGLADQINALQPDVMGTQEGMYHQLVWLDSVLAGYRFVGKGRDNGTNAGEFSAVFFLEEKYELLDTQTFWLSETPDVPSKGWDAAFNRVCTMVKLRAKRRQDTFTVFNVHLDHMGTEARAKSVEMLIQKTEALRKSGEKVVLLGDFNLEPEAEPILLLNRIFLNTRNTARLVEETHPGTFTGFNLEILAKPRIDYVFVSGKGVSVQRYIAPVHKANGRYPSDHFPVIADVHLE